MGQQRTADIESRFVAYVDGLAGVIGHGDRERPLRDYCTGLVMPCERKSVEPMAAVTAPARLSAASVAAAFRLVRRLGQTRMSWPKCARWCCRRSSGMGRLRRGSSMTGFPKQGGIRWA